MKIVIHGLVFHFFNETDMLKAYLEDKYILIQDINM